MSDENKPSTLYMGLFLGALMLIGLTTLQADLFSKYGKTSDDLSYLDVSSEVSGQAEELKESMEREITGIEPLDTFIAGTYNAIKILFGVGDLYTSFISDVGNILFIPAALSGLILAAIITSIIFAIVTIITKMRV